VPRAPVPTLRATFSIVAADPGTGEVGVAVQSKYFAVGSVVPWARAGVGAAATQAAGVAAFGPRALDGLVSGLAPEAALAAVLAADDARETRQLGVVAADGRAATVTGSSCLAWAGGRTGDGYAVQGNILAGEGVVVAMERAYLESPGAFPDRLLAALVAGQEAGGDVRGQQSAALVVERTGAGDVSREGIDRTCDLRVDDHPAPIDELGRLVGLWHGFEALRLATGHYEAGRFDEGIAALERALGRLPGEPGLLYDLACFECRAGRADAALAHLAAAVAAAPRYAAIARSDPDFVALAGEPRFVDLVGVG
jgi:uncharacterized Ntn-hydrolase superfamily protein